MKIEEIFIEPTRFASKVVELECMFAQYIEGEECYLISEDNANITVDAESKFFEGKAIKVLAAERLLTELSEKVHKGLLGSPYEFMGVCIIRGVIGVNQGIAIMPGFIQLPDNAGGVYEFNFSETT